MDIEIKHLFSPDRGKKLSMACLLVRLLLVTAVFLAPFNNGFAQSKSITDNLPVWQSVGSADMKNWSGLTPEANYAVLPGGGKALYRHPDGKKGWYQIGLRGFNDGVLHAKGMYGIKLDIQLQAEQPYDLKFVIKYPPQNGRHNMLDSSTALLRIQGKGWQSVTIPFESFDYPEGQIGFLRSLKEFNISGSYASGMKGKVLLKNVRMVKGNPVSLTAPVLSKPGDAESTVTYSACVSNSADVAHIVSLSFRKTGWEGMEASVSPKSLNLQPGETKEVTVSVKVPSLAPPGAQESQMLQATVAGSSVPVEKLEFITLRRLTGPYLVHTETGWNTVRAKAGKYDWAKAEYGKIITAANNFEVPETKPEGIPGDGGSPAVFKSYLEQKFWPVAIAYKLTGEKRYAEKIALLLNRLADPVKGYPLWLHANSQGIPQEGGFWEGACRSYDLIKDAGVLNKKEKELIEYSFRLYIHEVEAMMGDGGISNWSVFNLGPAAMCALAIQDMHHFNYLLYGPTGLADHLRYGMLDDGWWYEMSLSYNLGCAEVYTATALAARPFGIDLLNQKFPVSLTQKVGLRPFEFENFQGMAFGKFGPVKHNYVNIKRMWDGIVAFPDYRGIMFGMGDGHESEVAGSAFEMAYYAYRDTAYAAVIKQGKGRNLLFGVPELPDNTPLLYSLSAHADNAGLAVLRSQTSGRQQKEQIQAALKYGTHGSYHGHFDRISLVSLMRYGRSFWNPETSWYGYGSYMYKWWVQPSMSHNMVVVDGKQQEPKESKPLLFHSGKMMQVMAAETNARWSHPPYMGGYDQIERVQKGTAPYVPIPVNRPAIADVTEYTEPVLQRRMLIVTDDYVVISDYLQSDKEHTFDNLLHLRAAKPTGNLALKGHLSQFDNNPFSSGQFITNVNKYDISGVTKVASVLRAGSGENWGTGGYNGHQEPGVLNIDVWHAWPQKAELLIGDYAEAWPVNKKLKYEIAGDGKLLRSDSLATWILGKSDFSVDLKNLKDIQLKTYTDRKGNTANTLFWANARVVTSSGKIIPLTELKTKVENIIPIAQAGKDYKGGPVRIAGEAYTDIAAAEPENINKPGIITLDLSGLNAVKLTGLIGGDWVVGNEEQLRKTVSFRTSGKQARYLTVLEPYENKSMVKKVTALSADELHIELSDGRTQHIKIDQLGGRADAVRVKITEGKNGKISREEEAINK